MVKIDYYKFGVYEPYKIGGECHRHYERRRQPILSTCSKGTASVVIYSVAP